MDIAIREATLDDLDFLVEKRMIVLRAVFGKEALADKEALEKANRAYYKKALSDGSHIAALAYVGDTYVGGAALCVQEEMPSPDSPSGKTALLMNVYTHPDYRQLGVARKAIEWLIARAEGLGVDRIFLESTPDARHLYEEVGFVGALEFMQHVLSGNTEKH